MKKNTRKCIACGERFDKSVLLRINRSKDGVVEVDPDKTKMGRGAYVCKKEECMLKVDKKGLLNKAYRTNVGYKLAGRTNE